jgi:hypothetical protein
MRILTMTEHPITLPPELVDEWRRAPEYTDGLGKLTMVTITVDRLQYIATIAARWGSDQELEACCEWFKEEGWNSCHPEALRAARRPKPKPPSKEEALDQLFLSFDRGYLKKEAADTIRRALEQLDD